MLTHMKHVDVDFVHGPYMYTCVYFGTIVKTLFVTSMPPLMMLYTEHNGPMVEHRTFGQPMIFSKES